MHTISESIMCIAHRFERLGQKHIFAQADLSSVSAKILFVINMHRHISPSDIHDALGGTMSNISQRITYLEKNGFITRIHSTTDKRKISLSLTPLGKQKITDIKKWLKKGNVCIEKQFTKEEIAQHFAFCKKLHATLDTAEKQGIKNFLH